MRKRLCAALFLALPTLLHSQILNGDFPLLNQLSWEMTREKVVNLCIANKASVKENDSTTIINERLFNVDARTTMRFKNKTGALRVISVNFMEPTEKLADSLVGYFTRLSGKPPAKAEKQRNFVIITMQMEFAMWKTKTEKISVIVARRNKAIFDIMLSLEPLAL